MIGRSPFIVITLLCGLLAVVTPASAAPGWTLWAHTNSEVNGAPIRPGGDWDPLQAAPTERDCRAAVDTVAPASFGLLMGKFGASGATVNMEGTTVLVSWVDAKGRHLTRLHHICLPDALDPRGSKGK